MVFGILRFDPGTGTVVLTTPMPDAGCALLAAVGGASGYSSAISSFAGAAFENWTTAFDGFCVCVSVILLSPPRSEDCARESSPAAESASGPEVTSEAGCALARIVARLCLPWTSMIRRYGFGSKKAL